MYAVAIKAPGYHITMPSLLFFLSSFLPSQVCLLFPWPALTIEHLHACPAPRHKRRTPILTLARLSIDPHQTIRHEILHDGMRPRAVPAQIDLQHAHRHIAQHLHGLEHGTLVCVQLARHTANQPAVPNLHDAEAGAEGREGVDGAHDVVGADVHAAAYAGRGCDARGEVGERDEAAVLGAGGATLLDDEDAEIEIEVWDAGAEELGPDALPRGSSGEAGGGRAGGGIVVFGGGRAGALVAGGEEVDVEGCAHAGEFSAEGGVGANVFGVGEGEIVEQGLEDRELGGERGGVAGAQVGAVGGIVVGLEA